MRQRDPQERLALAGLHDGNPRRWIEWATTTGRVDVVTDGRDVLEQAVAEWAVGVQAHGLEQSVLIARNNDARSELNELARDQRAPQAPSVRSAPTGRSRSRLVTG